MATTVLPMVPPSTTERCDRCPAPARVRADLHRGELLFCAHHSRLHEASLLAGGAALVDLDSVPGFSGTPRARPSPAS
jgi:hypothetical protein